MAFITTNEPQKVEAGKCESCEICNEYIRLDLFKELPHYVV